MLETGGGYLPWIPIRQSKVPIVAFAELAVGAAAIDLNSEKELEYSVV